MSHPLKMVAVIVLLTLLYTGFGVIMNWQLTHIAGLVNILQKHPLTVTKGILTASRDSVAISRNIKDMILVHEPDHLRSRLTEIELYEQNIQENMALVYDRIVGQEGKDLTLKAMDLLAEQRKLRTKVTEAVFSNNIKRAYDLAKHEGIPLMNKIEQIMDKITHYAETRSMGYQVESTNELRRSKVVLFSAGLIIAILSLVFTISVEGPLLTSIRKTINKIREKSQAPINLAADFKIPSSAKINEALNGFFIELEHQLSKVKQQMVTLDNEVTNLRSRQKIPQSNIQQISLNINPIMDKFSTFIDDHRHNEKRFHTISNLLKQMLDNFALITQIISKDILTIQQIVIKQESAHKNDLLDKLIESNKSIQNNIDQSAQSITEISFSLASIMDGFSGIPTLVINSNDVITNISKLKEELLLCEQKLSEIKDQSKELLRSLNNFTC